MTHPRAAIRHAVTQFLVDAATAAGSRVFPTRKVPLRAAQLPALNVYTLVENIGDDSTAMQLDRELQVIVEGRVRLTANVDDALDDLALEVEVALQADPKLGGAVDEIRLVSTTISVDDSGNEEIGIAILEWLASYRTEIPLENPGDLDDLKEVGVEYPLTPPTQAPIDETTDEIDGLDQ